MVHLRLVYLALPLILAACGGTPSGVSLSVSSSNITTAGNLTLTATPQNNIVPTKVEFYSGSIIINTDNEAPFNYSVPLNDQNNGDKTFSSKAYTSTQSYTSNEVKVKVDIFGGELKASATTVPAPTSPISINTANIFTLSLENLVGIGSPSKVEFYDGNTLLGTRTQKPYAWNVYVQTADTKKHTFKAKIYRSSDNSSRDSVPLDVQYNIPTLVTSLSNNLNQSNLSMQFKVSSVNSLQPSYAFNVYDDISDTWSNNSYSSFSGNTLTVDFTGETLGLYRVNIKTNPSDAAKIFEFNKFSNKILLPSILQKTNLAFIPNADCASKYTSDQITNNMICTLSPNTNPFNSAVQTISDACTGDSGGPLVQTLNGGVVQMGIVSWGVGCGQSNQPGVFTKVSNYTNWVKTFVPNVQTRVIQGVDVSDKNTYPWMVGLLQGNAPVRNQHFCGGSLIAANWIMTAAHCVNSTKNTPSNIKVILQTNDFATNSPTILQVSEIHVHPNYDVVKSDNDIALLKLSSNSTVNSFVSLPNAPATDYSMATLIGWGNMSPSP